MIIVKSQVASRVENGPFLFLRAGENKAEGILRPLRPDDPLYNILVVIVLQLGEKDENE